MNKVGTSYLLWLGCLFGISGLHRLYNGKIATKFFGMAGSLVSLEQGGKPTQAALAA
ncbi:MAG: hypothetical protein KME12_16235 [Trichocoleus desertorum ATA4-8-CV12]|jgi:TM2 domain-containing membrane protein YozV|nr:hypothetical protein [Trichocoleus desertorum ATA4-8-CV12]